MFRETSDGDSEAYTLTGIGVIYQSMRNAQTALEYFPQAIAAWKAVGNREGEALALHDTGTALRLIGRFDEAMLNETLAIHRALDHRLLAAATLTQIGHTQLALGDVGAAFKAYEEGLALQGTAAEWRGEWAGSGAMGHVAERGDWPAGIELFSAGAGMFQAGGERDAEARILFSPLRNRANAADVRRGIDVLTRAEAYTSKIAEARNHAADAVLVIEAFQADVADPEVRVCTCVSRRGPRETRSYARLAAASISGRTARFANAIDSRVTTQTKLLDGASQYSQHVPFRRCQCRRRSSQPSASP